MWTQNVNFLNIHSGTGFTFDISIDSKSAIDFTILDVTIKYKTQILKCWA